MVRGEAQSEMDLSCTFCGPGTWATWEVVTDDGVIFACDRYYVEMSNTKIIRLERMRGREIWDEVQGVKEIFYEEEFSDKDIDDYE